MNASFTYAIRYLINAECASPMRTGNAGNDIERILTTHDGFAMLQGSSIAGALKAWFGESENAHKLFGNKDHESAIRVSDAVFDAGRVAVSRPRVCLDPRFGTSANKFDITGLPAGAKCSFELLWLGNQDDSKAAAEDIEDCLAAVQQGDITFGAQRSNGYGRMLLSVQKRCYDLFNAEDRKAWLADQIDGAASVDLQTYTAKDIVFDVQADIASILIKSSAPERKSEKQNTQIHFTENGVPILPGSSLKGAMRAQMTKTAPFLSVSQQELNGLLGRTAEGEDNGISGKIIWTDAVADEKTNRAITVTRIRINRITGGVMQCNMLTEEPISGHWRWQIRVPSDQKRGAMMILYALRDLGLGLYQLGGTQAVGRGAVRRLTVNIRCGKSTAVFTANAENGSLDLTDSENIVAVWEAAMGGNNDEA